ncbi:hypothetical protein ACE6H2_023213 [Prunus campanulata]
MSNPTPPPIFPFSTASDPSSLNQRKLSRWSELFDHSTFAKPELLSNATSRELEILWLTRFSEGTWRGSAPLKDKESKTE